MALYTIQQRGEDLPSDAEAIFVRQSFSWSAFLFGPFWLARHRLWLDLLVWIVLFLILTLGAARFLSATSVTLIILAGESFLGVEASRLIETRLAACGYRMTNVIAAANRDEAEVLFFRRREIVSPSSIPYGGRNSGVEV
ncbi:MAG TPA: DUF2628 domain-containing protein [Methylocella sp.]|nr:DUF2628 domain-containing protein [Methylocella sp.]